MDAPSFQVGRSPVSSRVPGENVRTLRGRPLSTVPGGIPSPLLNVPFSLSSYLSGCNKDLQNEKGL